MKSQLSVVKIGGHVLEDEQKLSAFIRCFSELPEPKILVHGGGKKASQLSLKLGIVPQLIDGRRITDQPTLEVITMVYAGLLNKHLVTQLQATACNAIGLSGADGNIILAHKRPIKNIDYGFVGDIEKVNVEAIKTLLNGSFVPVCCAMSHNGKGQLLNTNADTIAAELAISMSAIYETTLHYCFEKNGVLSDVTNEKSVIPHINQKSFKSLQENKQISNGMLPKLTNCFHALQRGVHAVHIGAISMLSNTSNLYTKITL